MSLASEVQNLATRVATECKSIRTLVNGNAADLSALNTTAKSNLVAAVNELQAALGASINDSATGASTTWSSTKISAELTGAVNGILNGAPAALDTLDELAQALGDDANFAGTVTTALANRVRVDAAQSFTGPQQAQGRSNIDAASATDVGDTSTNFVTTFESGLV